MGDRTVTLDLEDYEELRNKATRLRADVVRLAAEVAQVKNERDALNEACSLSHHEIIRIEARVKELEDDLDSEVTWKQAARAEVARLQEELDAVKRHRDICNERVRELETEMRDYRKASDAIEAEDDARIAALEEENVRLRGAMEAALVDIERAASEAQIVHSWQGAAQNAFRARDKIRGALQSAPPKES